MIVDNRLEMFFFGCISEIFFFIVGKLLEEKNRLKVDKYIYNKLCYILKCML